MPSLNDFVQLFVIDKLRMLRQRRAFGYDFEIVLDVDPNMPKLYEELTNGMPIVGALSQLELELRDAKPSKALFRTRFDENVQRLMIYHNGNQIPKTDLDYLNEFLDDIAERRREWPYFRHGNLIAGQAIREFGGRIRLENIDEDGYTVRTTMEIPVKATSS